MSMRRFQEQHNEVRLLQSLRTEKTTSTKYAVAYFVLHGTIDSHRQRHRFEFEAKSSAEQLPVDFNRKQNAVCNCDGSSIRKAIPLH